METERIKVPPPVSDPPLNPEPARRHLRSRRTLETPVVDITPGAGVEAGPAPATRLQLGLPTLSRERRQRLLELHRSAATILSRAMREHLREGDSFSFEGLSLETFRALSAQPEAGSVAAQFTFEEQRIDGFVRADAHLAAYLAHACFNAKAPPTDEGNPAPLTRLESVMAGRAITNLTRHLGEVYAGAGLGRMRSAMAGARMGDAGQFNPDDFMVVFRYQLGDPERGMHLTIATGTGLLAAMREDQSATKKAPESTEHKQMAVAVPVMAAIVIGVWTVSLAELAQVRVGDEIVLPDGDDAWIASGGVRLQAARVELIEGRWHAWPKGAARSAA